MTSWTGIPFEILRAPAEMRDRAESLRRDGRRIGVVPTMGFLHDGHLSLLRAARERCDALILTIFVNPTQFGPGEDLDRYPRDEAGDVANARQCGVDLVFCPEPTSMYSERYQTVVEVGELSQPLCGSRRPGHFRGVASVVTKLFNITRPHVAVFGQKDYQQLALLRRMNKDLDFGVEIIGMPIIRESDGLAMSSRNAYLSPSQRQQALSLHRGLEAARSSFDAGERAPAVLLAVALGPIADAPNARIDYVELRDAETLGDVSGPIDRPVVLAMAVAFGKTRLIDNCVLRPE